MFTCIYRQKFNKNSGSYSYHNNRYQATNSWNSNPHYTPQWRWVQEPRDSWRPGFNKSYKSKDANRQRSHSDEPAAKRPAVSRTTSQHAAAESAAPSDSLTNKLTERTSTIINDVLSGQGSSSAEKRAKTAAVQPDKAPAGNVPNTTRASSSGQTKKRPGGLPSDKPKNPGSGSDASRPKPSTSSASSHGNIQNVTVATKVQANKGPAPTRSDVLLSPNSSASRTGPEIQASLVRMATAPRSRREQLELERMIHEHAKKSAATKERVHDVQPSATETSMNPGTSSVQTVPQPADFARPIEGTGSSFANNVITIGDEAGNSGLTNVQDSRPSSSGSIQSKAGSSTGPEKSAKKSCVNKNKPKTARVPKAKVLAAKTAKAQVTKNQATKRNKKPKNVNYVRGNNVRGRGQRPGRPLPFIGTDSLCGRLNLDYLPGLGLGSLGLPPNLVPGLVSSQHLLSPSASRTTSLLAATTSPSAATEQGPLNTLLQMSLHEENLCSKLSQCGSEIEQLQSAIAKLDEELQKRIQLKATVSFFTFSFLFGLLPGVIFH